MFMTRLAQAIHRSSDFGQIPEYIADAVQTDGDKATAEIHDLLGRIGPGRADDLAQAVVEKLPTEHHQSFIGGPEGPFHGMESRREDQGPDDPPL